MPIFSGKKKYKRKNLIGKAKSQISNIGATKRGRRQLAAGVGVLTDFAVTGGKVTKAPFKGTAKLASWGLGKAVMYSGKARTGLSKMKKSATDMYNRGRYGSGKPIKVDKTLRLEAGKKPLGLPPKGSIPNVISPKPPVRTGPVKRGQGGRVKPKLTSTPNNRIVSNKLPGTGINIKAPNNPLNTTVLPKGPGTTSGTFKIPKEARILDSKINKIDASARKRAKVEIRKGQALPKQYGNFQARDKSAQKAKDIMSRANKRTDKIVTEIAKNTGQTKEYVKAANKRLATPAGKAKLDKNYRAAANRVSARVSAKPKGGKNILNPAGAAVSMIKSVDVARNPDKYQKGIFGGTVGIDSLPGYLARTSRGKQMTTQVSKIKGKVSKIKGKVSKRFKF